MIEEIKYSSGLQYIWNIQMDTNYWNIQIDTNGIC
jgi:hypothetical protein